MSFMYLVLNCVKRQIPWDILFRLFFFNYFFVFWVDSETYHFYLFLVAVFSVIIRLGRSLSKLGMSSFRNFCEILAAEYSTKATSLPEGFKVYEYFLLLRVIKCLFIYYFIEIFIS